MLVEAVVDQCLEIGKGRIIDAFRWLRLQEILVAFLPQSDQVGQLLIVRSAFEME